MSDPVGHQNVGFLMPRLKSDLPCPVAWLVAVSLGMQATPRLTPTSGTFFHENLVLKMLLRPFFLPCSFKKSGCQLMVKECTQSTGKELPGCSPRNSVVRVTDRPDMT